MTNLKPSSDFQNQTRALLSIRPQYATAILRGEKRYEFRRIIFSRHVHVVLIYVTAPVQRVVAEFDVISVITDSLPTLWKKTSRYAGIDEMSFLAYFNGLDTGNAIEIGEVRPYDKPFCPINEFGLKPPQSFAYLSSVE